MKAQLEKKQAGDVSSTFDRAGVTYIHAYMRTRDALANTLLGAASLYQQVAREPQAPLALPYNTYSSIIEGRDGLFFKKIMLYVCSSRSAYVYVLHLVPVQNQLISFQYQLYLGQFDRHVLNTVGTLQKKVYMQIKSLILSNKEIKDSRYMQGDTISKKNMQGDIY